MKKIAFQGRRGAYSESAAYHLFGNDIEVVPMDTFEQIRVPFTTTTTCFTSGAIQLSPKSSCRLNIRSAHCRAQSSKTLPKS